MNTQGSQLAIVMTGGGARAAYQVGLLRFLAKRSYLIKLGEADAEARCDEICEFLDL